MWKMLKYTGTQVETVALPVFTKAEIQKAAQGADTFQLVNPKGKSVYTRPISPAEHLIGIKE